VKKKSKKKRKKKIKILCATLETRATQGKTHNIRLWEKPDRGAAGKSLPTTLVDRNSNA
jgi:hypothetical protein